MGFGQILIYHFIALEGSPLVHAEAAADLYSDGTAVGQTAARIVDVKTAADPVAPETREIRRWFGSGHSVIIAIENACFDTDPPFIIL